MPKSKSTIRIDRTAGLLAAVLAGMFSFSIISCNPLSGEDRSVGELIPFAEGNYWLYPVWRSAPTLADTIRQEVVGEHVVTISGESVGVFGERQYVHPTNYAINQVQWLSRNEDDGVHSYGLLAENDTVIVQSLMYKYPGRVGDKWMYRRPYYDARTDSFRVPDAVLYELVDINGTFENEIASFAHCYVYRFEEVSWNPVYHWSHYVYVRPELGVVAVETRDVMWSEDYKNDPRVMGQWILIDHRIR